MKPPLKFAIIGCGRIAHRHAEIIISIGKLQAVCDIVFAKTDFFSKTYNAHAYSNLEDLLLNEKELDVIVICTPNGLHAQQAITALQSGKHVLVEKPMALHVGDCEAMMDAAKSAKKNLLIVKQNRFNPPVIALQELILKNSLGKIFNVQLNCFWNRNDAYYDSEWKGTKLLDGGILFTQFSHFIDLLYWLFGEIIYVEAMVNNFLHQSSIEFEDTGVAVLKFSNGILGTINFTINSYLKNMEGSITVFGEKGTVKIGGPYLNEITYQELENHTIANLPPGNMANDYITYTGSMSNHEQEYQQLLKVVASGSIEVNNAYDGLKTVEIIQKIYESAQKKHADKNVYNINS